jgi:hypothetical protein
LEGGKKLSFTVGASVLGGLLLVVGLYVFARPSLKKARDQTIELGKDAAKIATVVK